jgi:quercetin dioxygenase-like cupin family protein
MRAVDAETLTAGAATLHLLLDADATGGALSAHRVRLQAGAIGANPHRHGRSSEMFYVIDGNVDLLAGDRTMTASAGDLVVVPPGVPHAFAAGAGSDGELLIVVTPGVQRFDFFRRLVKVMNGDAEPASLGAEQEQYDNLAAQSAAWEQLRSPAPAPPTFVSFLPK